MVEEKYCDTSLIFLKSINKNIAKNLIIKNHYTHKWTLCTVAYGVYYKEYVESTFFGGFNAKLIGVDFLKRLVIIWIFYTFANVNIILEQR
jgi:hypothetical protein